MSVRKAPTTLRGKLWSLYREVRIDCDEPNKAPAVRRRLMILFRRKLGAIDGAEDHLLAVGLEADIRDMLKKEHDDDPIDDPLQLMLWPDRMRALVEDINRAHVFVPSRGEFVELTATSISKQEVHDAGVYLINKGQESIQVGGKLKRLATIWVDPGVIDYVRYCKALIDASTSADDLKARFDGDEDRRDKLKVPVAIRIELRASVEKRIEELGGLK